MFLLGMVAHLSGQAQHPPENHLHLKAFLLPIPVAPIAAAGAEYTIKDKVGIHASLTAWALRDEAGTQGLILDLEGRWYFADQRHAKTYVPCNCERDRKRIPGPEGTTAERKGFQFYLGGFVLGQQDRSTAFGGGWNQLAMVGPLLGTQYHFGRTAVDFNLGGGPAIGESDQRISLLGLLPKVGINIGWRLGKP